MMLQESINATYTAASPDDAYKVTDNMLKTLGDALAHTKHCTTCNSFIVLCLSACQNLRHTCLPLLLVKQHDGTLQLHATVV